MHRFPNSTRYLIVALLLYGGLLVVLSVSGVDVT